MNSKLALSVQSVRIVIIEKVVRQCMERFREMLEKGSGMQLEGMMLPEQAKRRRVLGSTGPHAARRVAYGSLEDDIAETFPRQEHACLA